MIIEFLYYKQSWLKIEQILEFFLKPSHLHHTLEVFEH